jgi:metallo-beta-lactamase class B
MNLRRALLAAAMLITLSSGATAQDDPLTRAYAAEDCPTCAGWNEPQRPVHLFGNTYYVGTRGLAALLIASPDGHVVIDGALPNSAPRILDNIRGLGFDPADVKLILNSHAHFDHGGGIAALQRATAARVAATSRGATVLESGAPPADDPQFGLLFNMPPVPDVEVVGDSQVVRAGRIELTAYLTEAHAPGGTTWSWQSCEGERCLTFVYADSQTPVSRDDFVFSGDDALLARFERSTRVIENLRCDVLVTPHPGASALWDRVATGLEGLVDSDACRRYAANARRMLAERLERERAAAGGTRP